MYQGCKKYIPFHPISLPDRQWPDKVIDKPPSGAVWIFATAIRLSWIR
jgi:hypothetical protein